MTPLPHLTIYLQPLKKKCVSGVKEQNQNKNNFQLTTSFSTWISVSKFKIFVNSICFLWLTSLLQALWVWNYSQRKCRRVQLMLPNFFVWMCWRNRWKQEAKSLHEIVYTNLYKIVLQIHEICLIYLAQWTWLWSNIISFQTELHC